jgi:2-oxoglutarate dehydrogenase complex dehydrogenase (E1) component-like enzyme
MGAWSFVQPRFKNLAGVHLNYVGRVELCQPAVGVTSVHHREAAQVIENTFK